MKFADRVSSFLSLAKSHGGEGNGDPGEGKKNLDVDDQDTDGADDTGSGDDMNKSDLFDATDILGDLVTELKEMNKSLKALTAKQETLEKSQLDVGEAIVAVSEVVGKIAGMPVSPKTVMAKGNLGGGTAGVSHTQPKTPPTQTEFERAQNVLNKSVQAGEISMIQAEIISSDLQKSMAIPGYTMKPENYEFLARKMQAA
jgi:hypothetical protein